MLPSIKISLYSDYSAVIFYACFVFSSAVAEISADQMS